MSAWKPGHEELITQTGNLRGASKELADAPTAFERVEFAARKLGGGLKNMAAGVTQAVGGAAANDPNLLLGESILELSDPESKLKAGMTGAASLKAGTELAAAIPDPRTGMREPTGEFERRIGQGFELAGENAFFAGMAGTAALRLMGEAGMKVALGSGVRAGTGQMVRGVIEDAAGIAAGNVVEGASGSKIAGGLTQLATTGVTGSALQSATSKKMQKARNDLMQESREGVPTLVGAGKGKDAGNAAERLRQEDLAAGVGGAQPVVTSRMLTQDIDAGPISKTEARLAREINPSAQRSVRRRVARQFGEKGPRPINEVIDSHSERRFIAAKAAFEDFDKKLPALQEVGAIDLTNTHAARASVNERLGASVSDLDPRTTPMLSVEGAARPQKSLDQVLTERKAAPAVNTEIVEVDLDEHGLARIGNDPDSKPFFVEDMDEDAQRLGKAFVIKTIADDPKVLSAHGTRKQAALRQYVIDHKPTEIFEDIPSMSLTQAQSVRTQMLRQKRAISDDPGSQREGLSIVIKALTKDIRDGVKAVGGDDLLAQWDEANSTFRLLSEQAENPLFLSLRLTGEGRELGAILGEGVSAREISNLRDSMGGINSPEWQEIGSAVLLDSLEKSRSRMGPSRPSKIARLDIPESKFDVLFGDDPVLKQNLEVLNRSDALVVSRGGTFHMSMNRIEAIFQDKLSFMRLMRSPRLVRSMSQFANMKNPEQAAEAFFQIQKFAKDSGIAVRFAIRQGTLEEQKEEARDAADRPQGKTEIGGFALDEQLSRDAAGKSFPAPQ